MATDPLLSHLTPVTISGPSTSEVFDFKPRKKEWSLRAAEGTVKINEWLGEVEGWNREWRRTYRESKHSGDGYLRPADRLKKGRKTGMGSIGEEEEGAMLDGSMPVRRSLFSGDSGTGGSGGLIVKDDRPEVGAVEAPKLQTDSPGLGRGGKQLTRYQFKMQRQRAVEVVNGERSEPDQIDDKKVPELDRQRRLADDERVGLGDVALAGRAKAREAKHQREREVQGVKAKTSVFSSPTGLGETVEEGLLPIELSEKVVKREISRDPTRATSASKNRSVALRSSMPTLGKALAKDREPRFILGLDSWATSTTTRYKVCIISSFGSISADCFDSRQRAGRRPWLLVDKVTALQAGHKNSPAE